MPTDPAVNEPARNSSLSGSPGVVHWLTLALLIGTGLAARLLHLTSKPYWFDECFSVEVARLNWPNFLHLLWWREANMSAYYVLLRLWLHLGHSEAFIRGLSVLISAATLPAIYWLGRLLFDRRVALIATAFLTVNAYHVRYAQEARSYALFVLLATLSSACLVAFLRSPEQRFRIAYVLASVLAVYAHFYALLLLLAQWLVVRCFGLPNGRSDIRPQLRSAWKIIGVAVAPLLIFVAKTGAGPIKWIPRPGLRQLAEFWEHLSGAVSWPVPVILAATCMAVLIPSGKRLLARNQAWTVWRSQFLLMWLLFPPLFVFLLSFARPLFLARYLISCMPALLVLAAAGFARVRPSWLLAAALVGFLALSPQGVSFVYGNDFDNERDAARAASNFILDHSQPGDAIVFHIAETRIPFEFFRSLRPPSSEPTLQVLFPSHGSALDCRDFTGKPPVELLEAQTPRFSRLWVMLMNNGTPEQPDATTLMMNRVLPGIFPKVEVWKFYRVEVRLYSKQ